MFIDKKIISLWQYVYPDNVQFSNFLTVQLSYANQSLEATCYHILLS